MEEMRLNANMIINSFLQKRAVLDYAVSIEESFWKVEVNTRTDLSFKP